ncbi:hypothetical protein HYPGJ_31473 [Hyphomicrobium sp. GJ21]|nr:hypothetical protein HYPGJ_31473 [Hyphomicrobium sp. GJ21]
MAGIGILRLEPVAGPLGDAFHQDLPAIHQLLQPAAQGAGLNVVAAEGGPEFSHRERRTILPERFTDSVRLFLYGWGTLHMRDFPSNWNLPGPVQTIN